MKHVLNQREEKPEAIVAIKEVCAWPNLTLLPDGVIIAAIHNQPSHIKTPGDIDCWASEDNGLEIQSDGGYPSSVQLPDGQIWTAYYARGIQGFNRYHMGLSYGLPKRQEDNDSGVKPHDK